MTTRKTSSSKSRTTSSKTSTGKKETSSRGALKATKSSSPKSRTAAAMKKNVEKLTSTQSTTTTSTRSQKQQKQTTKTSGTRQKKTAPGVKHTRSKDLDLFPHNMFPWRFEPRGKCDQNLAWFQCLEHVEKHVARYHLKPTQYKVICNAYAVPS